MINTRTNVATAGLRFGHGQQRRLDDGSRRLEHRGGDSHAPIRCHEVVALGDQLVHFGGRYRSLGDLIQFGGAA